MVTLLTTYLARRIVPFAACLTAFTVVMTILFLSFDLRAKHHELFNFTHDLDFSSVSQDNPQFIAYVRAVHLQTPPTPLRISDAIERTYNHQSLYVASLLKNKVNGTFVEAGAYSHGKSSTTEWLEISLGWHGLLIQADPRDFLNLRRQKRSKAVVVHACISPTHYLKEVLFQMPVIDGDTGHPNYTRVKCFPLFSLLLAAKLTKIDFLSLDAGGAEVQVLKTLPFNHIEIFVIGVEKRANKANLFDLLAAHRYKLVQELPDSYIFMLNHQLEYPLNSTQVKT